MKGIHSRLIQFFIGWPLSLVALFFIGKTLIGKGADIWTSIHDINPLVLFFAFIAFLFYFIVRGIFWQKLLQQEEIYIPFKDTLFFWGISELRRYIPGNIWSLISRTSYFGKKSNKKTIVRLQMYEASFIITSGALLSLLPINFLFFGVFTFLPLPHILIPLTVFSGLGGILAFLMFSSWKKHMPAIIRRVFHFGVPSYSFSQNLNLFLLMTVSWFCFGLGTYLSIDSFLYLYPPHMVPLVGFFVFSFLVGYLSFITPMGLGVREGVMALGISKYVSSLSLGLAGSIFARLLLIVAELCFVILAFALHTIKHPLLDKAITLFVKHKYQVLLVLAMVIYSVYFSTASILRYNNFYTGRFDLGNMDQTVWNTLHGHIFQLTDPDGTEIVSRLAYHADFLLVLLAPFYLIWQDPRTLLIIQTLVLAGGAVFVYLIAKKILKHGLLSLLFSTCYLLNPGLQHSNLYDFHPVVLATTFLLACWYFLMQKRYLWFLVFAFLAAITKEEIWIIVGLFGVYLAVKEKKWISGALLFAISVSLFYYLVSVAIPHARGKEHFALSYYSDFGNSPSSILKTMLLSPQKTFGTVFHPGQLYYLMEIFLPFGFLSLINPAALFFALPDLGINLLSSNAQLHQIYYQYTAAITPFLCIAAIYGAKYVMKRFHFKPKHVGYFIISTTVLTAYLYGPLIGAKSPNIDMFVKSQENQQILDNFLANIPGNFSVAATNNIGSHLSHRQKIFTIPTGLDKADIIVFLLNDVFAQPSLTAQKQMAEQMKHDKNYIEIFKLNDFVVFEKRNLYAHREPNLTNKKLYPLSIEALQERDYTGGEITKEKILETTSAFTTYLISYPSDGLKVYATMSIPRKELPENGFPVVILNRGFIPAKSYDIETSYKTANDYFAAHGFLVIRPEYRGNGASDTDQNLPKILAYPIDALNVLSSLQTVPEANAQAVFLWGHAYGSGVVLTTLEAHDQNKNSDIPIRAASIWAPVTDPYKGYARLHALFPSMKLPYGGIVNSVGSPTTNPLFWQSISPLYYIDDITTPIHISQGLLDTVVPYQWSIELFDDLKSDNKTASLSVYQGANHSFDHVTKSALDADIAFFRSFIP